MRPIQLAISTCPNDTFAFHAILNREIDLQGLDFEIELLDIQQLNQGLFAGRFDVAKASFHAAILLAEQTWVLPSGAALGFGVGPLLLSANPDSRPGSAKSGGRQLTLCPGEHTTAALLFELFFGNSTDVQHAVFSDIMPALQQKAADFGVCIHEGRFTWQNQNVFLVEDLGQRWEQETNCPLPLGGILARRSLNDATLTKVQSIIRESIQFGMEHREETLSTMKKYAQEFDEEVLFQHVDLYVNQWTLELGETGNRALDKLSQLATRADIASPSHPIQVFTPV